MAAGLALAIAPAGSAGYWIGRDRAPVRVGAAGAELRTRLGNEQDRARELGERLAAAQTALAQMAAREAVQRAELEAARRRLRAAGQAGRLRAFVLRYDILPGDTLWGLADRFYGQGQAWKRILRANAERLRDPNVLRPGQTILIPLP